MNHDHIDVKFDSSARNPSYKKKCHSVSNPDEIEALRNRNSELDHDIAILKKLVYMLNVELELRESTSTEINLKKNVSFNSKFNEEYLKNSDIKTIEPLLRAFDQTLKEKDELLLNYKRVFDEFSQRCKEVVLENTSLRQQLADSKRKVESSLNEWKKLHEKFSLTEEHNQLLARQIRLLKDKYQRIELVCRNNSKQFDGEKKDLNGKLESAKNELFLLKGRLSMVSDMKMPSVFNNSSCPNATFFSPVLTELKNLSTELKLQQVLEVQTLKARLKTTESQNCDLEIKLASIVAERDHLQGQVSAMKFETRQIDLKLKTLENELQLVKKNEDDARLQLMKSLVFIRELVSSQNLVTSSITFSTNANQNSPNEK